MEGRLFVLQDPGDSLESAFIERYFISYPFCGLKWFPSHPDLEPGSKALMNPSMSSVEGNWVYGGSLRIMAVFEDEIVVIKVKDMNRNGRRIKIQLFPFVLRVSTEAFGDITVCLASESEKDRKEWVIFISLCSMYPKIILSLNLSP